MAFTDKKNPLQRTQAHTQFSQPNALLKANIERAILQLEDMYDVNEKMLLTSPLDAKQRETLAKDLIGRTNRLKSMIDNSELLLFTLCTKTPQEKILQVRDSLQQRIITSIDVNEKIMLKEIYHHVAFAYQQKKESKTFSDIQIPCHQHEVKYLKHRDFTILKESDLNNSLSNHKYQRHQKKSNKKRTC